MPTALINDQMLRRKSANRVALFALYCTDCAVSTVRSVCPECLCILGEYTLCDNYAFTCAHSSILICTKTRPFLVETTPDPLFCYDTYPLVLAPKVTCRLSSALRLPVCPAHLWPPLDLIFAYKFLYYCQQFPFLMFFMDKATCRFYYALTMSAFIS